MDNNSEGDDNYLWFPSAPLWFKLKHLKLNCGFYNLRLFKISKTLGMKFSSCFLMSLSGSHYERLHQLRIEILVKK